MLIGLYYVRELVQYPDIIHDAGQYLAVDAIGSEILGVGLLSSFLANCQSFEPLFDGTITGVQSRMRCDNPYRGVSQVISIQNFQNSAAIDQSEHLKIIMILTPIDSVLTYHAGCYSTEVA